jgi:hypothetical protein
MSGTLPLALEAVLPAVAVLAAELLELEPQAASHGSAPRPVSPTPATLINLRRAILESSDSFISTIEPILSFRKS